SYVSQSANHRDLHSLPTRRFPICPTWGTYWDWDPRITSTTLLFILLVGYLALRRVDNESGIAAQRGMRAAIVGLLLMPNVMIVQDRKSTRLNSSHVKISYAVFCLK